jgi:diguanylate cyclase (GGDEF)-like protein
MNNNYDKLTGLVSGVELNAEMEALIVKGIEFSLIILDIDGLLVINRDYGVEAGDAIFRLIAKHIGGLFAEPCIAFRDTRDQFDILLPAFTKEQAFLKAEQLRKLVCEAQLDYASADGAPMKQTISVGVSAYPEDGSRPADVFRRADGAMVRAKKGGRNLVCLAREEKLIPKTSHYTQAQLEKLSLIAEKLGVGEAALLREALDVLLKMYDVDDTTS